MKVVAPRSTVWWAATIAVASCAHEPGRFADRAVVWHEDDNQHLPTSPKPNQLQREQVALFIRDSFRREIDRKLSLEEPRRASDLNALDEVPCSTWFCARNHLATLSPAAVAAGPPGATPPELPLTVVSGKIEGITPGFAVTDARGEKYLVKIDPAGNPQLASGAEVVSSRILHAAGYNVPAAFPVRLAPSDLRIHPDAKRLLSGVAERSFPRDQLDQTLAAGARNGRGEFTGVAVSWLPGKVLGGFDYSGRRVDDPNDRINHEDRRSLRASWVLFAWINNHDISSINTLDTYVEENGRRFVRHHFIDFGCALGSASTGTKAVFHGRKWVLDPRHSMAALFSLGVYQRPWQRDAEMWRVASLERPTVGWFRPVDDWDPETFRSGRKVPAHLRATWADKYWGAKVVTSFTDEQIQAIVDSVGYEGEGGAFVRGALIKRRDRIGARYLTEVTAVERPAVHGGALCFEDLAISRGFAPAATVQHAFQLADAAGRTVGKGSQAATGARVCLPVTTGSQRNDYLVMTIVSFIGPRRARPAHVHLAWRARESRFVVVGLERDDS